MLIGWANDDFFSSSGTMELPWSAGFLRGVVIISIIDMLEICGVISIVFKFNHPKEMTLKLIFESDHISQHHLGSFFTFLLNLWRIIEFCVTPIQNLWQKICFPSILHYVHIGVRAHFRVGVNANHLARIYYQGNVIYAFRFLYMKTKILNSLW